ncbi:DsrE family protein [Paenibacillaceae bacterium WGS1546]|uniref:DsrE family protein n=1 Tax=Cohnella sp. WGS1546 TaxID=3366810 RepID=UPI00372D1AC6
MAKIFVHLTHGPEAPTQADRAFLIAKAALEEGHAVSMFLAGAAVTLMREEAMDHVYGFGLKLREYYDFIIEKGGRIYLSSMSCESRGMTAEDLRGKAVTLASPNDLVNLSVEHDRMFTYG